MPKMVHSLLACVAGLRMVCGCAAQTAKSVPTPARLNQTVRILSRQTFPGVALRGYGVVAGESETVAAPAGQATLLHGHCADEAVAKLLCAKYLSDVMPLPKVTAIKVAIPSNPTGPIAAREVEGQGCLAAGRVGPEVTLVAAGSGADLAWVIGQTVGLDQAVWESETLVPMWLDRLDKFGFRFYYRPWETPKGETRATYDVFQVFDFADKAQRSGFVFWGGADNMDTAEGLTNNPFWDWALQAATLKNLPIGLNPGIGPVEAGWLFNRYREQTQPKAPQFTGNYHGVADNHHGGNGMFSWNATTGKDAELAVSQEQIRQVAKLPNTVTYMEPHQELHHDKVYLTPRNALARAPQEWFTLQRNWWRGTTKPTGRPLPPPAHKFSVDLSADWSFMPL